MERPSVLHLTQTHFASARVEISLIGDIVSAERTILSRESLDKVLYLYLLEGGVRVALSDVGERVLSANDILVVFPGRIVTVELTGALNRLMLVELSGRDAVCVSLDMGYWDLMTSSEHYEGNFMTEIIDRFHAAPGRGRDSEVLALVEQLLESVWVRARNGSGRRAFFDTIRTVNQLPDKGLTTEMAADALQISRSKLNALFQKGLGVRPGEYIAQIRSARAQALLFWTNMSVAQIAQKMGFSSASAFATFLRHRIGQTPAEFRNRPVSETVAKPKNTNSF